MAKIIIVLLAALFIAQAKADPYVGAGIGETRVGNQNDGSFKMFGGYDWSRYGIEIGYVNFGTFEIKPADPYDRSKNPDATVYVAATARTCHVFAQLGVHRWKTYRWYNNIDDHASDTGIEPMFGIGAYATVRGVRLRIDYQRFLNIGDQVTTGQVDADVVFVSMAFRLEP